MCGSLVARGIVHACRYGCNALLYAPLLHVHPCGCLLPKPLFPSHHKHIMHTARRSAKFTFIPYNDIVVYLLGSGEYEDLGGAQCFC